MTVRQAMLSVPLLLAVGCSKPAQPSASESQDAATAKADVAVWARATGQNLGDVDTTIAVTAKPTTILRHHSNFDGGGIWEETTVHIDGKYVKVTDTSSISTTNRDGKEKMETTERIFLFPVELIREEQVVVRNGSIVLTKGRPTSRSTGRDGAWQESAPPRP